MFKNANHVFSSPQWTTIPFETHPKGPFDQLVDILFSLLPCLTIANQMIQSRANEPRVLTAELKTLALETISRLHHWWAQCIAVKDLGEFNAGVRANTAKADSEDLPFRPDHFPILPQSDMPTAALGALYDAANILAFRLLFLVLPSACLYEPRIQRHAQSILSAKKFISTIPGPVSNRGSTMVGFPFQILRIWCPPVESGDAQGLPDASDKLFANVAAYVLQPYKTKITRRRGFS